LFLGDVGWPPDGSRWLRTLWVAPNGIREALGVSQDSAWRFRSSQGFGWTG